jgi:glycosyltransferase involved in cell wall biosynthesis
MLFNTRVRTKPERSAITRCWYCAEKTRQPNRSQASKPSCNSFYRLAGTRCGHPGIAKDSRTANCSTPYRRARTLAAEEILSKHIRKVGVEGSVIVQPAVPHHEIPALIAEADICIAPLVLNDRNVTQGACPIKVLEYMAAGRPLVASNMPLVREVVREEVDALLFSPNDLDDLARRVLALLNDFELSKRIAQSASERALTKFTWHEAQKRLLKVL